MTDFASSSPVTFAINGRIGIVRIDNPPVNAVSGSVVAGLSQALNAFDSAVELTALVICCAGRTFVAGGDISTFDDPDFSAKPFNNVLAHIESTNRPVIAAMHGTVLGGGLELALACHWRTALPDTIFGLPEVKLGLLPGSLGTQRLPRLIGVESALALIASGRTVGAREAMELGLIDVIGIGSVEAAGLQLAQRCRLEDVPVRRLSFRTVKHEATDDANLATALEQSTRSPYPSTKAIVQAVRASLLPFNEGELVEARLFEELRKSSESRALRHLFFAQREATKIPSLPKAVNPRTIESIGILGGGTMGRGIAMNFLNAGLSTLLVETSQDRLDAGLSTIRELYSASAAKGKISKSDVGTRLSLLSGSVDVLALGGVDMVIEAVFENMDLKKQVMASLGAVCKPGAIIATNTSTLDVDALALASGRPADLLGTHFFSPANVMKLLEVVRGAATAPDVLATVMRLARKIGKVAVVSGVCYGFIGNRMAEPYMREAEFLIMEGADPAHVDAAVERIGMAMGPCRMLDMAGIDVGAKTVIEYAKAGGLPPDDSYRALARRLFELGRFGQKTGAGYYKYEGRQAVTDPATGDIAAALAKKHGISRRSAISEAEIFERLFYPMVNEAAKILEEKIAYRPGDIDVIWTSGYGFPDYKGGPLFLADEIGPEVILRGMERYASERGNGFGYWTPSDLLRSLAATGKRFLDWEARP